MGVLKDLSGTERKEIPVLFIKNIEDIQVVLNNGMACTDAGSNGAINIWKDDENKIRCEAMKYMSSVELKIYDKISDAKRWYSRWKTKIYS